eukprot:5142345-Prymnesium_polylepis.1
MHHTTPGPIRDASSPLSEQARQEGGRLMLIAAQWPAHEYHAHRVHPNGLGPQPFRRRQCSARTST